MQGSLLENLLLLEKNKEDLSGNFPRSGIPDIIGGNSFVPNDFCRVKRGNHDPLSIQKLGQKSTKNNSALKHCGYGLAYRRMDSLYPSVPFVLKNVLPHSHAGMFFPKNVSTLRGSYGKRKGQVRLG